MTKFERAIIDLLNGPNRVFFDPEDGLFLSFAPSAEPYSDQHWRRLVLWPQASRNVTDSERREIHQAMMAVLDTEVVFMQPQVRENGLLGWWFLFSAKDGLRPAYQKERV